MTNSNSKEWTARIADALTSTRARRILTNILRDVESQKSEISAKRDKEIYSASEASRLLAACDECSADIASAIASLPAGSK